jgi:Co/Zn/Cd efflux system component
MGPKKLVGADLYSGHLWHWRQLRLAFVSVHANASNSVTRTVGHTVLVVAALNLAYFGVEFTAALRIGSVSLLADSVDFLEDAAVNILIFLALGWTVRRRAALGFGLAALMMVPAAALLWTLLQKLTGAVPPDPFTLTLVGAGALAINFTCASLLVRHRNQHSSLIRAAYLSARNDVLANIAIIGAGMATYATHSIWPDIVVGLGIAALNLDAAREVWEAARRESRTPVA